MPLPSTSIRDAEAGVAGFAQQLAKSIRKYFTDEIKKRQQDITYTLRRQANNLKARATSLAKSAKSAQKKINKYL